MADVLRNKVSAGEYASESEVIREGLRTLFARDRAVEAWLQTEVAEAYDAAVSDPAGTVSAQAVRERLAGEQASSG
jgi:putative addiction module CopG family antidote